MKHTQTSSSNSPYNLAGILPPGSMFIVLAAVLWALDGILRRSLFSLPPLTIVFYEHLIGAVLLTPYFITSLKKETISKESYGWAVVISLLSGLLGTLWFTTALVKVNFIAFSVVFLLQKLQPIFATSSAALLLKEKVTPAYMKWAGLAMIAAYFVTFPGGVVNLDSGTGTITAALYAVGAAAAWGSATAFSKKLLSAQSHVVATGLRFYLTTLFALVASFVFLPTNPTPMLDAAQLSKFVFIAVSTGMVALLLYYRGLKTTQAKVSTILELVFPVLAVFVDAVLYKTVLAPSQYLAAAVLLFAIHRTAILHRSA